MADVSNGKHEGKRLGKVTVAVDGDERSRVEMRDMSRLTGQLACIWAAKIDHRPTPANMLKRQAVQAVMGRMFRMRRGLERQQRPPVA